MTDAPDPAGLTDPDGVYADLLAAHAGLSEADSTALNARLILILMNQVGDEAARTAIRLAVKTAPPAR